MLWGTLRTRKKTLEGIFVSPRQPGRPRVLSNDRRHLLDSHSPQMKGGAECRLALLNGDVRRRKKREKKKEREKGKTEQTQQVNDKAVTDQRPTGFVPRKRL